MTANIQISLTALLIGISCLESSNIIFCRAFMMQPMVIVRQPQASRFASVRHLSAETDNDTNDESVPIGDPLRAASGIRPSLHPTAINAIAEALKLRATGKEPLTVSETVKPLQVAMAAGEIAAKAIEQRQKSSEQDGMKLTNEEAQTIAGRVVGVVMRFGEIETLLSKKVSAVEWVQKYGQWNDFGIMEDERNVQERIQDDPLFSMCRAECLLALFLNTIELPRLLEAGQSVPDKSVLDFIDDDRRDVLLAIE